MAMESSTTSSHSVVAEFEGTLLKSQDSFSYFMLVAFEVSLIRFTILLFLWPVIALLDVFSYKNATLKLMIFVTMAGVRKSEIELVARAVLPKFYMDDVCMDTWNVFSSYKKNVLVTRMPQVMVEMFAKEHLSASEVIGTELIVNGFGFVTGLIRESDIDQSLLKRVDHLFVDRKPHLGLGRPTKTASTTFLSLCEEQVHAPIQWNHGDQQLELQPPKPVIFHDGRLVKRPTPVMALLILLWFPFGIILAVIRLFLILVLPLWATSYILGILGLRVTVKGKPPQPPVARNSSLLFVGNHRSPIDGLVLFHALGRIIPSISFTSNVSRLPARILSPVPLVWISRTRDIDGEKIKQALSKGDLMMFPEGIYGGEPFLLRFSALFAELTNGIVPFAMNDTAGLFRATVRGWPALNFIFLAMNPMVFYEVTFLDQLLVEDTCSSGKSSYDVANHVQKILADKLKFECTGLTRKDKYKLLT